MLTTYSVSSCKKKREKAKSPLILPGYWAQELFENQAHLPELSVVVSTWNSAGRLERFLHNLSCRCATECLGRYPRSSSAESSRFEITESGPCKRGEIKNIKNKDKIFNWHWRLHVSNTKRRLGIPVIDIHIQTVGNPQAFWELRHSYNIHITYQTLHTMTAIALELDNYERPIYKPFRGYEEYYFIVKQRSHLCSSNERSSILSTLYRRPYWIYSRILSYKNITKEISLFKDLANTI